ncbi:heterogeneous nuclear ribonucleoprotein 1-like [Impatiens glandulifera]|uniref:heterogeneous nuclear ribonucleoprotein 1-like n=1 Tax=Impatiens glandulifera TaxID=253017 RepID=UPI001FB0E8AF|nr:heterogeneous nuclear ribonucleoprotein 1-like [Impatiens glandulifera]XP_047332633.1 heterogeneous nuclear ribonucleoprotein 1-like [Impatiens glandulifera]
MDLHMGKLFVGGISWDTDECRLKEYFSSYGEVIEAVIMRDRATGRARGFGFVVFSDPAIAERVVLEKHMIDGRTVEAKKAVPRDDQQILIRNNNCGGLQGSPVPGRTKKIFVGGLASSVAEIDFKKYFDQFGTINDVVVMYDHNTQRPRGFGFITYDCEEAVDRALYRTFHELNGKMVEVKRAVPKELSPGSIRSPLTTAGYSYGFSRAILNGYPQGYNMSPVGGYGVRMDGRYNPFNRTGFSPFGSMGFGVGMNLDGGGGNVNFGGNSNFGNGIGYGRIISPFYGANSNRYAPPIGYGGINIQTDPCINSPARNACVGGVGGGCLSASANNSSPNTYFTAGNGSFGVFGNNGLNLGPSQLSPQGSGLASGYTTGGHMGYGNRESHYRLRGSEFGGNSIRNIVSSGISEGDFYGNDIPYGDPWRSVPSEINAPNSYSYGADGTPDVTTTVNKGSEGYCGHYNSLPQRQTNRGIAT